MQLHVKLPGAGRVITLRAFGTESVGAICARIGAEGGPDAAVASAVAGGRLTLAGQALAADLTLAQCNISQDSVLLLQLRGPAPLPLRGPAPLPADPHAGLRAALAAARLRDFGEFEKVGGRDIAAVGAAAAGYSQHGVCSYVYKAVFNGGGEHAGAVVAIKVMLNTTGRQQTVGIAAEFSAEQELLSDVRRLPAHPNVMTVFRSFTDDAIDLPGWDFERDFVQSKTMMVVMPFVPKDLRNVLRAFHRTADGAPFDEGRAARLCGHLSRALEHLERHGIVHRDVKLDNVLVNNVGEADEYPILADFGHVFDCEKNQVENFCLELRYDGFQRGGAPAMLAPEVGLPVPGPGVYLNYRRNDAWACGLVKVPANSHYKTN